MMVLFWLTFSVVVYTYLLYPLGLFIRGRFFRHTFRKAEVNARISILIAAHNEAGAIKEKLDNLLGVQYPRDRLEILVASDGSTDGTDEIVQEYAPHGIRLLSLPRVGKADALNAAVAASSGDILVFTDANSMFAPNALQELVSPFADPKIGGVAGNQVYQKTAGANQSEHSYWNFDRLLKSFQSMAGNAISATGAIYAIRRDLFQPIPPGVTDDFITSTRVIAQGYRLVFAPQAIAYEPATKSNDAEFARKVRITTRGLQAVLTMRSLMNPFHYGFYAVQMFTHKVLRRLVVFPLIVLLVASISLWYHGWFYDLMILGQSAFYGSALAGFLLRSSSLGRMKLLSLPFYFCMVYSAALLATINLVRGRKIDRWEPQRQEQNAIQV